SRATSAFTPYSRRILDDRASLSLYHCPIVRADKVLGEHRSCKIRRLLDSSSFSYCWQAHSSVGRLDILCQRSLRTTEKALSRYRRRWSPRSRHWCLGC